MKFLDALVAAVLRRRRFVLAFFALAVAALLPGVARLQSDNSPEVFFLAGSSDLASYRDFVARFGTGHGVRIVLGGTQLWSADGLAFLDRLEREIAGIPGVQSVNGPVGHHRRELVTFPPTDPAGFRALLRANDLDRALGFVTASGSELSLVVELAPGQGREQEALLAELERRTASPPAGVKASVVGAATLERALDESAREVGQFYFPLLLILSALLLAAMFRELAAVAVPLVFVAAVELPVLGAMGYGGVKFNLVLAILPPILFVIALASAVHIMMRCRDIEAEGLDAVEATLATYKDKSRALLWTTVSTLAGFLSLAATPVAPIRTLGLWSGVGLAFTGIAAFTLLPCLLAMTMGRRTNLPERVLERRLQQLGRRLTDLAADHRRTVLLIYGGLALLAVTGLPRLVVASNALHYLAPDHPARASIEAVEAEGIGLSSIELVLSVSGSSAAGEGAGFRDPERLDQLARFAAELRRLPGLFSAVTATDLLDDIGRASPMARAFTPAELRSRLLPLVESDAAGRRALERFLSPDGTRARLTLFVPTVGYEAVDPLIAEVRRVAATTLPGAAVVVTGQFPLLLAMQRYLISTLAMSLILTLPVLALTFYILLRDARGTFYALAPNLWPVLLILGGMGWFGVPLDIATVMVASITLGLVVDDTIHTLAHYRELRVEMGERAAVADRMEKTAPAYLLTGIILSCGFGVCALSNFAPTARFGVLSGVAIVIAVIADFTLVPALFGQDRPTETAELPVSPRR